MCLCVCKRHIYPIIVNWFPFSTRILILVLALVARRRRRLVAVVATACNYTGSRRGLLLQGCLIVGIVQMFNIDSESKLSNCSFPKSTP